MKEKRKNIIYLLVVGVLFFGLAAWCWGKPEQKFSESERRVLEKFPALTAEALLSGDYMEDFEQAAQDQFPMRDGFRGLKSATALYALGQMDVNGLYMAEGHISREEYPLNENMISYAAAHIRKICETYLSGRTEGIYLAVVPDKNYYLAEQSGRLALDYDALTAQLTAQTGLHNIDLFSQLSLEDYYRTDTHWRQEKLTGIAETLGGAMGADVRGEYELRTADAPFYGVYYGQLALKGAPDSISYLTNDTLENCIVTSYDTGEGKPSAIYRQEKLSGRDAYEFFLGGSESLIVIENPALEEKKELILFRDSFGSSLAPLLLEGYSKITLVDTRYIQSDLLGDFLEFSDQDVLFLYSTVLLNNSLAFK